MNPQTTLFHLARQRQGPSRHVSTLEGPPGISDLCLQMTFLLAFFFDEMNQNVTSAFYHNKPNHQLFGKKTSPQMLSLQEGIMKPWRIVSVFFWINGTFSCERLLKFEYIYIHIIASYTIVCFFPMCSFFRWIIFCLEFLLQQDFFSQKNGQSPGIPFNYDTTSLRMTAPKLGISQLGWTGWTWATTI